MVPDPTATGMASCPCSAASSATHMLVFGIELRVGEDKRFAAVMPGAAERFQEGLPGGGKGVRVGDQQGRLVAELLPKYLWRPAQHPLAQFNPTGFLRSAYGLG